MALDKTGKPLPKGITWRAKEGRYMGRFQHEGKVYTRYDTNKTALIKTMENLRYEVIHGLVGRSDKLTFGKWFDEWLNTFKRGRIRESSYNNYLNLYKNNLEEPLGRKQLDSIKPHHIQRLYNELLEDRGISTKYLSNINSNLYRRQANRSRTHPKGERERLPRSRHNSAPPRRGRPIPGLARQEH